MLVLQHTESEKWHNSLIKDSPQVLHFQEGANTQETAAFLEVSKTLTQQQGSLWLISCHLKLVTLCFVGQKSEPNEHNQKGLTTGVIRVKKDWITYCRDHVNGYRSHL